MRQLVVEKGYFHMEKLEIWRVIAEKKGVWD